MKNILKLAICTGIITPFCASAQLISVTEPSPDVAFNTLVGLMAADGTSLYVGNGEANPTPFSQFHWDDSTSSWVIGSFGADAADLNFQLQLTNQNYFYMRGDINVGFVANENWNLNELFVNAYALGDTGNSDPRVSLFDYSDRPVNSPSDFPPDTALLEVEDGVDVPVVLEFEHVNQTASPFGPLYQSSEIRFNMFRQVLLDQGGQVAGYGNGWFFGINDKNETNDEDGDDGYFYLTGEISPVPEPSQIAALSILGLGALLFVRRRIAKRSRK